MTKEKLGILILENRDQFYRIARSVLRNDSDTADAISESVVKAFSNIYSLSDEAHAKTWFIRILINECYQLIRQNGRMIPVEDVRGTESYKEDHQDYSDLYDAVDHLPPDEQLVINLFYMEGYRISEIAAMIGISENTVKSRLKRARERLNRYLTDSQPDEKEDRKAERSPL